MTEPTDRREALRRAERIARFREELSELERGGILVLGREQRQRVEAHLERELTGLVTRFGLDASASAERISTGVRVGALLGSAALFLAAVLFLLRIWGWLSEPAQLAILLAAPLLPLAAAEALARRDVGPYFVTLFVVAAIGAFAAELGALQGVLNVAPGPQVLLAVGLHALLLSFAYGSRLALAAGLLLLIVYTAALAVAAAGEFWGAFPERAETLLPAAAVAYSTPSLARAARVRDFALVFQGCGAGAALFALLLLSLTGAQSYLPLHDRTVETIYQVAGLTVSVGLIVHGVRLERRALVNLGAGAFVLFLYVKLHAWWWAWMPKYLFFLTIGLIAVALVLVFRRLLRRMATRGAT